MPRTLAQNAQYIAETIKPAIKQAIEDKGVTVPSTDSFLDYADRIGEISGGGSGYQLKDLPTGSISTVSDAEPLPLNALKVSVEAWQEGSGDPSPSNVRPIHGWDAANVSDVGKNLFNTTTSINNTYINNNGEETSYPNWYASTYVAVKPNTEMTFIPHSSAGDVARHAFYNESKEFISAINSGEQTFTTPSNCKYMRFSYRNDSTDVQLYINQTTTISLPQTVYGGELDVVNGILKITDGYIASYNGESLPSSWISDRDVYASGTTPTTGAEVVYKLATPTTISQQPLSIRMLEGVNNLYADCGDVLEGEYFVDEGAIDVRKVDYTIGSNTALKISDGRILQGFANMANYHSRPLDASGNWLDVDWSKDFEIGVAFKFTSFSANQAIFASADANRELVPTILWVASDATGQNQLRVLVSTDGSSWEVACITSFVPIINTFYFIKMKYESATKKCITQVTSDFIDWTVIENDTLATHPYYNGAGTAIGGRGGSSAWATNNLLIDTFNTYIKGDGVNWGASTGAFPS